MATLNVKDFPNALHERLKALAARERRSVAQQVIVLLEGAVEETEPHSLLELDGLGASYWRTTDAAEHVAAERDAWD